MVETAQMQTDELLKIYNALDEDARLTMLVQLYANDRSSWQLLINALADKETQWEKKQTK